MAIITKKLYKTLGIFPEFFFDKLYFENDKPCRFLFTNYLFLQ